MPIELIGREKDHIERIRNNRGFTMVELLVALFVFVIAAGSAFATFTASAQLAESARNRMVALQDARAVLEEVKAVQLAEVTNIAIYDHVSLVLNNGGQWVSILPNESMTLTTNPADVTGVTLATVTVTVTWDGVGGRQQSLSLTTQKSAY